MQTQSSQEGQSIPEITFRARRDGDWFDVTSHELFAERRVAVFALPGAFTPTCSSTHLPRYEELAAEFAAAGIDEIICVSVNDGFVMEAWGRDQGIERVRMLPDGNGDFTAGIGMLVDKRDLGFGMRSWRYSMIVDDGVIEKMFIEPDVAGDPFAVSDADTLLQHLNPDAAAAAEHVLVFSRPGCPHCVRAKALLDAKGKRYEEVSLGGGFSHAALQAATGETSVPQIFIDGVRIGGADALEVHYSEEAA
jgi:glutaredoxin-like protein